MRLSNGVKSNDAGENRMIQSNVEGVLVEKFSVPLSLYFANCAE